MEKTYALLLAAGMSTRMGKPKALLDWGGRPLVLHQIESLKEAGVDEVVLVLGHRADDIHRILPAGAARVVLNPRYHQGRATSVQVGASAIGRDAGTIAVVNIDQPVRVETLNQLIATSQRSGKAVTVPSYQGRRGHPLVLSGALANELRNVREETQGVHALLKAHAAAIEEVPVDDASVLLDINTPSEYESARPATATA